MPRLQTCSFCGGGIRPKTLPYHDEQWHGNTYRFENVPALVCAVCGEIYFEAAVSQAMDKVLTSNPKPKGFVQVPIVEFPLDAKTKVGA